MNIFDLLKTNANKRIPDQKNNALTGTQFVKHLDGINFQVRETEIYYYLTIGNLPNFLRNFVSITISENNNEITYLVMSDVLSIGTDDDYLRMPMGAPTAKLIANKFNCILPTKKIADQINKSAQIRLEPVPKGAPYDISMLTTVTYDWNNQQIEKQLQGSDKTLLITGQKKDVVIDKALLSKPDRVAIYGWFKPNGIPIQGPTVNSNSHELNYQDYSHGIRLIYQDVIVNGELKNIYDVLKDPNLAYLISEQGPYDASQIYQ